VTKRVLWAALAALLLAPAAARAASPVYGSLELRVGGYHPDVDRGALTTPGPWETVFGGGRPLEFQLHAAKALYRDFGTFELGVGAGFFQATGKGRFVDGTVSGDSTAFRMVPTSLSLTWRLDVLSDRWNVPLVPYGRASLERYNWWVTGGSGATVKTGATNGYSYGGGLGLVLDFFDPGLARELDNDTGINHTMAVVDVKKTVVDDFGSKKSWDLSDTQLTVTFGLLFVF
jgi:hypothetical protein